MTASGSRDFKIKTPMLEEVAGAARAPVPGSARLGQLDLDFEHFEVVLAIELDLDVVRVDLDVFANDFQQIALQGRQIVRPRSIAIAALVREDDLQPFLGDRGRLLFFGLP